VLEGPFTAPTIDLLKLGALHVTTALQIATATTPPANVNASEGTAD
jgi:hypothetical protein